MNCPHCDRFSPSSRICVHCGENLPSISRTQSAKFKIRDLGSSSFTKVLYALLLVLVIYGAYSVFARGGNIPSYMNEGPVDLGAMIVSNKTNIVDLYSDYCPPCVQIAPYLKKLDESREDIALIKIDINRSGVQGIDWQSPVARQFKLRSIPHFIVVSPSGKIKFQGKKAYKFVLDQLRDEGLI